MVGVPRLEKCDCGPSSLISSQICLRCKKRIKGGARKKENKKPKKTAIAVLKVIYLKTFKNA